MNIRNLTKNQQKRLLDSLNEYYINADLRDEHLDNFDELVNRFPDGILNLAYTTYGENEQFDIQVNFNLNKMRYEEWINNELFYKPNESYDRTFDDFCDEIESCDFESMIRNCASECIDREENPERMYQILKDRLFHLYDSDVAENEYRKILWYKQKTDKSIYDIVDFNGNYDEKMIENYYKNHDVPSAKMWTEDVFALNNVIGNIQAFVDSLNKDQKGKTSEKDNVKAKGL